MVKTRIQFFEIIYILAGIPWLFLMIMTSGAYTGIKMILLAFLCITSLGEIICNGARLPRKVTIFVMVMIVYFSLSLLFGIWRGYKFDWTDDKSLIYTYIFTPIIILLLSMIFYSKPARKHFLFKLITVLTIILEVLDLGQLLAYSKLIPNIPIFNFVKVSSDNFIDELTYRISNEAAFMFLLPLFAVLLFKTQEKKRKLLYGIITILGIFYSLLSGRKMLELVFFGTIIAFALLELKKATSIKLLKMILGALAVGVVLFYGLQYFSDELGLDSIIEKAWSTLTSGLSRSASGSESRIDNAIALFDLWVKSPIFGNGLNAYAIDSLANHTTLWSYEVVYNALLAQAGIVGICIFFYPIYKMVKWLFRKYKKDGNPLHLAVMVAFICFILCGASNPLVYFIWPWAITLSFSYDDSEWFIC